MSEFVQISPRDPPSEITSKLDSWQRLWSESVKIHYAFGGLSVAASAAAAASGGEVARYLAAFAAVLTALIGFVHPERRYFKYVRAWRVLDIAALRYRHGLLELKELVDAVERGEVLISEFEDKKEDESARGT